MLLQSPFQKAKALIVVENRDKNDYFWVNIKQGKAIVPILISNSMSPKIAVHTLLIRGRSNKSSSNTFDRSRPKTMAATSWLHVIPEDNQLKLNLKHSSKHLPGSPMPIDIVMTDNNVNPPKW